MNWDYLLSQVELTEAEDQRKRLQDFLSARGSEGWELVSVTLKTFTNPSGNVDQYTMFFKKPK